MASSFWSRSSTSQQTHKMNSHCQWRSYRGGPGSILALKKYTFSYVATNVTSFFSTESLRFRYSCPPPGKCPSNATDAKQNCEVKCSNENRPYCSGHPQVSAWRDDIICMNVWKQILIPHETWTPYNAKSNQRPVFVTNRYFRRMWFCGWGWSHPSMSDCTPGGLQLSVQVLTWTWHLAVTL